MRQLAILGLLLVAGVAIAAPIPKTELSPPKGSPPSFASAEFQDGKLTLVTFQQITEQVPVTVTRTVTVVKMVNGQMVQEQVPVSETRYTTKTKLVPTTTSYMTESILFADLNGKTLTAEDAGKRIGKLAPVLLLEGEVKDGKPTLVMPDKFFLAALKDDVVIVVRPVQKAPIPVPPPLPVDPLPKAKILPAPVEKN
jgi:hypothetical protein